MNPRRILLIGATALTLTLAATACSSDGSSSDGTSPAAVPTESPDPVTSDPGSATIEGDTVEISKSRFDPIEVDVQVGDTVTFHNNDAFEHTVTSKDEAPAAFDSGKLGQDEMFQFMFTETGTYDYFCQIHPTMRATVVVG